MIMDIKNQNHIHHTIMMREDHHSNTTHRQATIDLSHTYMKQLYIKDMILTLVLIDIPSLGEKNILIGIIFEYLVKISLQADK